MIETATLIKTGEDTKSTPGIESVSEFENWCMIDGKSYKVRIVVKKQPDRYFAYYFGAIGQDKKTAIMGIPASPFGCTDLNITVSGYRLIIVSSKYAGLSIDPFITPQPLPSDKLPKDI
jgi:hypothetical protein